MSKHKWKDEKLGCAFEATLPPGEQLAIAAVFDREREKRVSQDREGWSIPHYFVREFFRLAARVKELEAGIEISVESRARRAEAHAANLAERLAELEAATAPLLPLFRAWLVQFSRFNSPESIAAFGGKEERMPDTIAMTAEFPVEALRALTKE